MLLLAGFSFLSGPYLLMKILLPGQNAFLRYYFRNLRYRFLAYPRPFWPRQLSRGPLLRVDYAVAASKPTPLLF